MIKILLILTIVALIIFISCAFYTYYKRRKNYYQNICDFCFYICSQIGYLKTDLIQLIQQKTSSYQKEFNYTLNAFKNSLVSKKYQKEFENSLKTISILSQSEIEEIINFFNNLGKTNQSEQLSLIETYKQNFENRLKNANDEISKKGIVNLKLGILLAVTVFVILI